ncbi:DUF2200 domain-containing protein [Draconibacterium sediminis]|uniref:DUF2200 domain-containing protein n=1 Tax=Draconibacterium sediminis TaxID=1544798 RepID=UPI000AADE3CA|nr:DUF2200 domain-containing protein [Draconibacterium sediminis]
MNISKIDERIAQMTFASVYLLHAAEIEKKGRSISELREVIEWLIGFDDKKLRELIELEATFEAFF